MNDKEESKIEDFVKRLDEYVESAIQQNIAQDNEVNYRRTREENLELLKRSLTELIGGLR